MGRENLADLWIFTWLASVAIVPIYGWLVARFRRSVFLPWTYGAVALSLVLVGLTLHDGIPSVRVGQFFWVLISVLNLFIISVFWSFLVELFRTDQAKRLFGVIAAGGTAGALAGPLFTDLAVATIGNAGVLYVGGALFALAVAAQRVLLRIWRERPVSVEPEERAIGGNPLGGISLIARSPYLLAIALFVFLLASVSTFLYFEQLRLVEAAIVDAEARTRFFARIDWIVQSLTIVSQLFLTGWIASRFGLATLLSMVPIVTVLGFAALAVWNTLPVLAVVFVGRRFGEYAFVRPGREMLWAPLDKETKYKAKNLVDVPVYRGGDAVVAQLQTGIEGAGVGPQAIAVIGGVTAAVWALNGWWIGRKHDQEGPREKAKGPRADLGLRPALGP
jgi:AAA family ATP:ADP antiporter